ncbi:MAG: hypothetical protein ABIK96_07335 [bacterium]
MLSWRMCTVRPRKGTSPSVPMMAVRWKPVGMLPSRYCLRVMCTSLTTLQPSIMVMAMLMSRAASSISNGGASSIS